MVETHLTPADGLHVSALRETCWGSSGLAFLFRLREKTMASIPPPETPFAAVTHPDPYPFYAELVARRPLYRDASLGLWVAASAKAVGAVLDSARCRVRPLAEPVPPHLRGSALGTLFGRLVRMTDGPLHCPLKRAVSSTLASVEPGQVLALSQSWARTLLERTLPNQGQGLEAFCFQLSVHVLSSLLGLKAECLLETAEAVDDLVMALSSEKALERGTVAFAFLLELFSTELASPRPGGLLARLGEEGQKAGMPTDVVVANAIGFLTQAYEATAGLIGNTVLALSARPELRRALRREPGLWGDVLLEVQRHDGPVQNTRRFVATGGLVAGEPMAEGDVVLVLLAAANRDPSENSEPAVFDVFRTARRMFGFGQGAHACPGQALSLAIARAGVEQLLESHLAPEEVLKAVGYRASFNLRIPRFADRGHHS
jgi:cytochrome P450